jgi:hypothetical protein
MNISNEIIRLVPITEIARRGKVCSRTLARKIAAAGIKPDALLIAGTRKPPTPAFVESYVPLLLTLVK